MVSVAEWDESHGTPPLMLRFCATGRTPRRTRRATTSGNGRRFWHA